MKQRRHLKSKISATTAATILSIALAGSTCGTFAWFMYTTRAKVIEDLEGVTIGAGNLEVGILSEADLPEAELYGLIKDDSNPNQTIYWFIGHTMEPDTLGYVLSANDYATNTLIPVTTRKYANGDDFNLFSTPKVDSNDEDEEAIKKGQIYLPLVFRYSDILEDEEVYIPNQNISISQVKLEVLENDSHIHEAVRIHTDNRAGSTHLINPSSQEDGSTNVGGILDLNGDGYYDYWSESGGVYEHLYGQVAESNYKANPEVDDTQVGPLPNQNAFVAGHKQGVYALDSYVPETADYEGFYGYRNKRKWVTTTNPQTNNYAYLDLSIFIEGWDIHVINREIEVPFAMEIKFEALL